MREAQASLFYWSLIPAGTYAITSMKRFPEVELTVETLSSRGTGLAVHGENTVEIPFTRPGDRVRVELQRKRRGLRQARLLDLVESSTGRCQARCAHFGTCGGCIWQHLPYEEQLSTKQEWIQSTLKTEPKLVHQIIPCDPPWEYRNKMEYSFSQNKAGDHFLGLMMAAGRGKVVDLQECHLPRPWFAEALKVVRDWWTQSGLHAYHPPSDRGSLRNLTLREGMSSGDRMVVLLVSGNPDYALNKEQLATFRDTITAHCAPEQGQLSVFLRIQQAQKGHVTQFYEMLLDGPDHIRETLHVGGRDYLLHISPAAFFQPNTRQAERLYQRAFEMLELPEGGVVYDLYCGTGTLGLFASAKASRVIGIELSPESSLDARENAKRNGVENLEVYTGDVGKVLSELGGPPADLVMVDPPRAGLDDTALKHVLSLGAPTLLYISCNPTTQAENLGAFTEAGYRVTAVQPVDQFPHTRHVENIVVLRR